MMTYLLIKTLHIISATVLFGTGIGTAFQMLRAHRSGNREAIAETAHSVVLADAIFTTPAIIIQPLTGVALAHLAGFDLWSSWLVVSLALYVLAGACWLPVVWLQLRCRDLARAAVHSNTPLPAQYHRFMGIWFALGWPAFAALIVIFWLMTAKPVIW
jgi:uncharacterized membrane protein